MLNLLYKVYTCKKKIMVSLMHLAPSLEAEAGWYKNRYVRTGRILKICCSRYLTSTEARAGY